MNARPSESGTENAPICSLYGTRYGSCAQPCCRHAAHNTRTGTLDLHRRARRRAAMRSPTVPTSAAVGMRRQLSRCAAPRLVCWRHAVRRTPCFRVLLTIRSMRDDGERNSTPFAPASCTRGPRRTIVWEGAGRTPRMHAACCLLYVACCLLHIACCLLYIASCLLHVVCCTLHVVCRARDGGVAAPARSTRACGTSRSIPATPVTCNTAAPGCPHRCIHVQRTWLVACAAPRSAPCMRCMLRVVWCTVKSPGNE
jgi:hypothetical protein